MIGLRAKTITHGIFVGIVCLDLNSVKTGKTPENQEHYVFVKMY